MNSHFPPSLNLPSVAKLACRSFVRSAWSRVLDVLNSTSLQAVFFVGLVANFFALSDTMRIPQEFYLDKIVTDRLIDNHFDASHNTLRTVRRIADIYEWGNRVLWPGLLADSPGACGEAVGAEPGYSYSDASAARTANASCNAMRWPDGDGVFHVDGATPYTVGELVQRMDQFDWTEGVRIWQARTSASECVDTEQLGECYPELGYDPGGAEPYGYNHSHPTEPLAAPFTWLSPEALGASPLGVSSANALSMKTYASGGFVALVIPFFSDTFLPYEEGTADQLIDFRDHRVTTSNGRNASYHCVRTSTNGIFLRQECDPGTNGDGSGVLTGAVRRHIERFWNDLKRAHFIDSRTRTVTVTLQLKSNHVGVRCACRTPHAALLDGHRTRAFHDTAAERACAAHLCVRQTE